MVPLLLTIASAISIAAILRMSEDRRGDRFVVAGMNYVIACLLSLAIAPGDGQRIDITDALFAIGVGFGFAGGFLALMRAINEIGLAVPATAARLSTLVPVVGSVLMFGEAPTIMQISGIGVGVAAFLVLGAAQRRQHNSDGMGVVGLWLLIAVFAIAGGVDFSLKIAQETGAARGPFLAIVFATACLVCVAGVIARRSTPRRRDIAIGAVLGVPNFFASYFLLGALEQLDGVVVFPVMNASVVVGISIVAITVWRERPNRLTTIGLALAALAVIMLGMG